MASLPTGTVTFLFTDIEGSTDLLQRLGDRRYVEVLEEHRRLLRDAFAEGHGQEIDAQGDAFLVAFARARDALGTAVAAQRTLTKHTWPDGVSLRVRMGLHTGEPVGETAGYVGLDVHRAARICSAGHGGQILLSDAVSGLAARDLPPGVSLRGLGTHRLKDLRDPEHLFQVMHPDLPADFPPLKSLDARPNNLPIQLTSFIGRAQEIAEVKHLLSAARLVTLTGSGGAGKTRLALQVAVDVMEDHPDGVWLAEFAPKEIGSKPIVAYALRNLGLGAYDQANYQQAAEFYREGLIRSREVGNRWLSRECLEGLAWVACAQGRYEHSARLLGAAEALREHFGLRRPPVDQAEHDRRVVSARTALGEAAFAATWAEGRAMTLEQAIEYALASEEPRVQSDTAG